MLPTLKPFFTKFAGLMWSENRIFPELCNATILTTKLYIPSTLNTHYLLWHTQLIKILHRGLNHELLFSLLSCWGEKSTLGLFMLRSFKS